MFTGSSALIGVLVIFDYSNIRGNYVNRADVVEQFVGVVSFIFPKRK